jgi:MFS family permease
VSFAAPLAALARMRTSELQARLPVKTQGGQLRDGLRFAAGHRDVLWPTVLAGVFGMFTANLAVTLAAYARSVFHSGPGGYGLLSAIAAVGAVTGALISAARPGRRMPTLLVIGSVLAATEMLSAAAPGRGIFCLLLLPIGACTLLLLTSTNSAVQTAATDAIRGRIMGIYLLVFIGSASLGGPLLGLVDQHLGPRTGMLLAGAVPAFATALIAAKLAIDGTFASPGRSASDLQAEPRHDLTIRRTHARTALRSPSSSR